MVSPMTKTGIVAAVGIVVIVLASTLGWIAFPNIAASQAVVKPENEEVYAAWTKPPVPITIQFYLFNCTNCGESEIAGGKPVLKEIGPFTFRETREKWEIVSNDGLLTYRENITYYHAPFPGEPGLDAEIISPSPIYFTLQSLIYYASQIPGSYDELLPNAIHKLLETYGEHPFMVHKAGEMLFDGWSLENLHPIINQINEFLPVELPLIEKFGYFYGRNGSNSGTFTIESGANHLNELGFIKAWNGNEKLDFWNDQYCDMINGTDGAIYPPMLSTDPDNKVYLFTPDICRAIYTTYEKDIEYLGIPGHRYTVPEIVFGDYKTNPDNLCYCVEKNTTRCFEAGVLDLRSCLVGAPMLLSSPHFYLGAQTYVDAIDGINPDKEKHETFIDLEPLTSIPIFASKKIQFNIDVRRYGVPGRFLNISNFVFPVFWLDESAGLDDATANDIQTLESVVNGINIGRWCFLAAGIALFLAASVMFVVYSPMFK